MPYVSLTHHSQFQNCIFFMQCYYESKLAQVLPITFFNSTKSFKFQDNSGLGKADNHDCWLIKGRIFHNTIISIHTWDALGSLGYQNLSRSTGHGCSGTAAGRNCLLIWGRQHGLILIHAMQDQAMQILVQSFGSLNMLEWDFKSYTGSFLVVNTSCVIFSTVMLNCRQFSHAWYFTEWGFTCKPYLISLCSMYVWLL